jgi:dihydrofolate reductase
VHTTVFIAASVDGFIARENGGLDWLPVEEGALPAEGEDYGYRALMETVDVIVMGRNSFETVRAFPTWPYGDTAVVVLTHRPLDIPEALAFTVQAMAGSPAEIVARLQAHGRHHAYVDGGNVIQSFLAAGLIQRVIITRVPVLLGSGIPLFGKLPHDVLFRHLSTEAYPNGLVQSRYDVISSER